MLRKSPVEITKEDILNKFWEYIRHNVEKCGDKPYILTRDGRLTFKENNNRANAIQQQISRQYLHQAGVGLFIADPVKIVPAMIGVLKSGNFFIPLDVVHPDVTINQVIHTADIRLILTDAYHLSRIQQVVEDDIPVINLDDINFEAIYPEPVITYKPEDTIRILFTSGSLGEPKGAIEDYRFLARKIYLGLIDGDTRFDDIILLLSTFSYSATWLVTIRGLFYGTTIYFHDLKADGFADLASVILDNKITIFRATPAVFRGFIETIDREMRFPGVRHAIVGGEKLLNRDLTAIRRHFPGVKYYIPNFSATETHRVSQSHLLLDQDLDDIRITAGYPCDDLKVFIWDENGTRLPQGEEGEIVVYSDTLVRGYINDPVLTNERFIPDPDNPGFRYYKTGDLGKILPDGQLQHLGRIDNMVKVKGVRVELSSIENLALGYPGVVQVATRSVDDGHGNKKIVLYFVTESGITVPITELRKYLAERLPSQQIPQYYINLDELPLTGTGKVAIGKLPPPRTTRPELPYLFVPAADDLERGLQQVWEDQLGISDIGVLDDFFDLGGDSLLGAVLMAAIEESTGKSLPVSVLLQASTIRLLAGLIRGMDTSQEFSTFIPIQTTGTLPPLFFVPGKGGYPTRIRHLVKALDPQMPVYAFQNITDPGRSSHDTRQIRSIAALLLSEMRKISTGPYILVGESLGGKICYEIARQLKAQYDQEPHVFLLDTYYLPESKYKHEYKFHKLKYYEMLVKKHLRIWIKSDWRGKKEYLRFYRETFFRKVSDWIKHRHPASQKDDQSLSAIPGAIRSQEGRLVDASRKYTADPYPGKVVLIKALRGPGADSKANGWDEVSIGRLIIHHLDCYHGSILFEPAVSQLARIIQNHIPDCGDPDGSVLPKS